MAALPTPEIPNFEFRIVNGPAQRPAPTVGMQNGDYCCRGGSPRPPCFLPLIRQSCRARCPHRAVLPLIRPPYGSHLLLSRRRLTPLSATQTFPLSRGIPEGKANRFKIVGEGLRALPVFCNVSRQGVGTLPYIGMQKGVYNGARGLSLPKFRIPNSEL